MFLLLISFIAGVLTVLAPCILPLLPIIVGGSLSDGGVNRKKSWTIIISLGISVIAFTLLLKASTVFINIPESTWQIVSGSIVLLLGLIMLFPSLWENQFIARISAKSNILLGKGSQKNSFWGDVLVGAALGPVFSTCSPTYFIVLATVLPVSPFVGMVYLLTYTLGLCLALLVVSHIGQKIMNKLGVVADSRGIFKRVVGVLFIIVGLTIMSGLDKKLQTSLVGAGFFDITKIEQKLLEINNESQDSSSENTTEEMLQEQEAMAETDGGENKSTYLSDSQKKKKYKTVPELSSIDGYINTSGEPVTLAELEGKVVLLDIWTYSCINCQRTIPYLNEWYSKYRDQGLEIVGLHTPEFAFERLQTNVEKAVEKFGIKYPVVLDNDYSTWRELGNNYWPRKYLIDLDGYIVYDHIGEGAYAETEKQIQEALKELASRMDVDVKISEEISKPAGVVSVDTSKVSSPEVYFGANRNSLLGNGLSRTLGEQNFSLPQEISKNKLYLSGTWEMTSEHAQNTGMASVVFKYGAKNVYMVTSAEGSVEVEIYRDGVFMKKVNIKDEQLYSLIEGADYGEHKLEIKIPKAGLKAFTFTFG